MFAPVRGARIMLADNDGVRANMTASWLAQIEHRSVCGRSIGPGRSDRGRAMDRPDPAARADARALPARTRRSCSRTPPRNCRARFHVERESCEARIYRERTGSCARGSRTHSTTCARYPKRSATCSRAADQCARAFAAPELAALTGKPVHVFAGGTSAWIDAGLPVESGDERLASPRIDRYRRPYEGTDNAREAMSAYLEWEYGLVAQLERDGTHGFFVI